ncbi:LysR family transcriptional regulator [Haliea sp. E17]|uniref:LysR family transcriptional regulator n=1 Tax=Haliea sp. E17 TaxID=3401576 RepID=UPI003AAC0BB1
MSHKNMDLRSLRHVATLADTLNYTRAAEELGLTQSALSRSIQGFEQRMETRLFDRNRGGVQLTAVGRRFVERAKQLLRDADELERSLLLESGAAAGDVAFGMAPMPAKALLAGCLQTVLAETPELVTRVTVRRAEALLNLLQAAQLEFFVCADGQLPDTAPLRAVSLGHCNLRLLVRPRHPLLRGRQSGRRSYPLLVPDHLRGSAGARFAAVPALAGAQHLVEDYGTAAKIAATTDAIWVASDIAAAGELAEGLLVNLPAERFGLRVDSYRLMFYSLSQRTLSPAATRIRSLLQQQMGELQGS